MDLTAIDRTRYQNDARRALVEYLKHYLTTEHAAILRRWHGMDIAFEYPAMAPEDTLKRPRIIVAEPRDETSRTFVTAGQTQRYGEWHQLEFEIRVETDGGTGGTLTGTDVAGAIELCLADHAADLEVIGLNLLSKTTEPGTTNPDTGLLEKVVRVQLDMQVTGEAFRTLELELARWRFTAMGQGEFAAGVTLETPHKLLIHLLTGTGTNASAVTIVATNADGAVRRLVATIPPTRSAGTTVLVVDEDLDDEYTSVTSIIVSPGSGLPGETFAVKNIPKELGG